MRPRFLLVFFSGLLVVGFGGALALYLALAFGRPPQALPLGRVQRNYETGVTVKKVLRARELAIGGQRYRADGEFYLVDAVVYTPNGLRIHWDDRRVEVRTFAFSGRTRPPGRFAVDARVQAALDRIDGRPGPRHEIRGAQGHEWLVFDLPRDVEQPAILFEDANDPWNALDVLFGDAWMPHRFNLRYD